MSEMSFGEVIKLYDANNIETVLNGLTESEASNIFEKTLCRSRFIIPFGIRSQRNKFIKKLLKITLDRKWHDLASLINDKFDLAVKSEELFDDLKSSLKTLDINNHSLVSKVWAYIEVFSAAVNDISKYTEEHYNNIFSQYEVNNVIPFPLPDIKNEDNTSTNPDYLIYALSYHLTITLKNIYYNNKDFLSGNEIVLPLNREDIIIPNIILDDLNMAVCWMKLLEISHRSLYFGGGFELERNNGIKLYSTTYEISNNDCYEAIAIFRLGKRREQVIFDIKKFRNEFQNHDHLADYVLLSDILGYDLHEDYTLYEGLTLDQWFYVYSKLTSINKQFPNKKNNIFSKKELSDFFGELISVDAIDIVLNSLALKLDSEDFFDNPIIKIEGNMFYISSIFVKYLDVTKIMLSRFYNNNDNKKKGDKFEKKVFDELKSLGCKYNFQVFSPEFKNKNGEEYQYDSLVVWEDKIFIVECKNRSVPQGSPEQSLNYQEMTNDVYNRQIPRLKNGLINNTGFIGKALQKNIESYEIFGIMLNSLPYSVNSGDSDTIFTSDYSSLMRFFECGTMGSVKIGSNDEERVQITHKLWGDEMPNSDDLVKYLRNPPQIDLYANFLVDFNENRQTSEEKYFTYKGVFVDNSKVSESLVKLTS